MTIEDVEVENKATVFLMTMYDRHTQKCRKVERKGYRFVYFGATWYFHKQSGSGWGITEATTGAYAAGGATRPLALKNLKNIIAQRGLSERKLAKQIRMARMLREGDYANRTVSN